MESDNTYRWFYSFKYAFEAEKYVMCITNKWLRGMFARFRLKACGLKNKNKNKKHQKQQQRFPPNNRETLPAQYVVRREKMR